MKTITVRTARVGKGVKLYEYEIYPTRAEAMRQGNIVSRKYRCAWDVRKVGQGWTLFTTIKKK